MRMSKTIAGVAFFVTAAGAATALFGNSFGSEASLSAASVGDLEIWHHVKSVWLPSLLGWLLMLQAPLMLTYLAIALWVFFQERKHDQIYDATKTARDKAEREREAAAETLFQEHVARLSPELIDALQRERVLKSSAGCGFGATRLREASALDFFTEAWRSDIIRSLEEQIPLPALNEEVERNWRRYRSSWFDLEEAVIKSSLILAGSAIAALLGYALAFV